MYHKTEVTLSKLNKILVEVYQIVKCNTPYKK